MLREPISCMSPAFKITHLVQGMLGSTLLRPAAGQAEVGRSEHPYVAQALDVTLTIPDEAWPVQYFVSVLLAKPELGCFEDPLNTEVLIIKLAIPDKACSVQYFVSVLLLRLYLGCLQHSLATHALIITFTMPDKHTFCNLLASYYRSSRS